MGVYIKGMTLKEFNEFMDILGGIINPSKLIEVTEPHGDLIDRERIDYKNYKMHDGRGNLIVSDTFVDGVTWVDNCIYDTPTVIEAEASDAENGM